MPLVTVVIPSYNCAAFVPQAIESVLGQSLDDFEIIIVDDGSTDNTRQVVERFLADERVRYVYQSNRGLPGARNSGAEIARGEFVAALDADDLLPTTALEEMTRALVDSGASWCMIDILKFWEDYQEVQKTEIPKDNLFLGILRNDFIRRAMFFRKTELLRVGMWDESIRMREDWELNIRLIASGEPFVYIEKPLYNYRRRPESITTGDPSKLLFYEEQLLRKHHKRRADGGDPAIARIYATNMWSLARRRLYLGRDLRGAFRCLRESLTYDFSFARLIHPLIHRMARCSLADARESSPFSSK